MCNCIISTLAVAFLAVAAPAALAQNQAWIRQIGTSAFDVADSAAPDGSGGLYLSGDTEGSLAGPNAGLSDVWLARYDSAGNQIWIRQLGTSADDFAFATTQGVSGGVFVGGCTNGSLGGANAGAYDAWLACYDDAGNQVWIRQLGTSVDDDVQGMAPDGLGGVFVSGGTSGNLGGPQGGQGDAWLARYDSAGNQTWIRQLGTSGPDDIRAAAPDGLSGVYVTGMTWGSLGGRT